MVIICLTCLSPWLLALQGQRTWQMEVLNVGWMNQYVNEWMNDGRVSYLPISSSLSEPLSITMETPQNLVLGWSPQFSIVKGLPCAMIYSEALVANHKQSVLRAFFTRDEWVHFPTHLAVHGAWPAGLSQPQPAVSLGHICTVTWKMLTLSSTSQGDLELLGHGWGRCLWDKKGLAFPAGPKEV